MEGKAIAGMEVAFTGRLATMSRAEAMDHVAAADGRPVRFPGVATDIVVVGQAGWPVDGDGALTRGLSRFRELKESGSSIRLVTETDFLGILGLQDELDDLTRLYTTSQLSRIVDVPGSRIRSWTRHGLIRPVKVAKRLAWFGFKDVVLARAIGQLTDSGVSPSRIRESLQRLGAWFPDAGGLIGRLEAFETSLHVRLDDGNLAEVDGQLLLDFRQRDNNGTGIVEAVPISARGSWFGLGVQAEDGGDLPAAARAYDQALKAGETEPEVYFNLGNVLYDLGREADAAELYLQALDKDREYAEAWNNLGNALSAVGKVKDAVRAYETAIAVEPAYADAHCNLAAALDQLGRPADAYQHRTVCQEAYPRRLRLVRVEDECSSDY